MERWKPYGEITLGLHGADRGADGIKVSGISIGPGKPPLAGTLNEARSNKVLVQDEHDRFKASGLSVKVI